MRGRDQAPRGTMRVSARRVLQSSVRPSATRTMSRLHHHPWELFDEADARQTLALAEEAVASARTVIQEVANGGVY